MSLTRRRFTKFSLASLSALTGVFTSISSLASTASGAPVPVILDTDIGDDLDDTWALLLLLRLTNVDIKLITTDFGNTVYRTRLLAKLLEQSGNAQVPVGIGLDPTDKLGNQSEWLGDYQLAQYPGKVHRDGVDAIINVIMNSPEPITLLCIGPVTNIAEALRREPRIANNARFIGMQGSIRVGYDGEKKPAIEWNFKVDPKALQTVFAAPWDCTITPLDTCGTIQLQGELYQQIFRSRNGWMQMLVDNYKIWLPKVTWLDPKPDLEKMSSTLFDTLAVYLLHSDSAVVMEDLPLRVTDEGYTVIDEDNGRTVHCATSWKDKMAFEKELVKLLTTTGQAT